MKKTKHISLFITLFCSVLLFAQEAEREDDLGDVSDTFQTQFFEAIKQKGIENYDKAIDLLVACKTQEPNNEAVYFELGKNYFELNKYQLAENAFQKANILKPNNEWILVALYKLHSATKNNAKITQALEQLAPFKNKYRQTLANHYYVNREYKKALQTIDQLNSSQGVGAKNEKLRYQIYSRQKKHDEIVNYVEKKISNKTAQPYDFTQLIYTYSILKNNDKAFEVAEAFQKAYPSANKPYVSLYKYYLSKGDIDKAITAMHRVTESNRTVSLGEKYKVLNDFFNFTKKNLQYLPELEKALKNCPNKSITNKLMHLYEATNNTKKADAIIEDALKNESTNFNDLKGLTTILLAKNKFNDALTTSTKAIALYPAQPVLYLQQAKALMGNQKAKKALESLEMGIDYIIDNTVMEQDFYLLFVKAYTLLGDTKNLKKYQSKIKK